MWSYAEGGTIPHMKLEIKVDHLHEVGALIATIDRHRVGALILLVALLGMPALALGGYLLLR